MVHAHPGHEGDRAVHPAGRQRPADVGDLRRGPVSVRRNDSAAEQEGAGSRRPRLQDSAGPGRHQAARHRRELDQLRPGRARRAGGGGNPGRPGRQRGGRRPADSGSTRRRDDRRIRAPNPPGRNHPRRSAIRRPRSRDRRDPAVRAVRRAGRARRAGRRQVRPQSRRGRAGGAGVPVAGARSSPPLSEPWTRAGAHG